MFQCSTVVLKSLSCNISCVSSIILRSDILQKYVRVLPDCSYAISYNFSRVYTYRTVTFCVDDRDGDVFVVATFKPQLQDQNRVLYPGLDHLQVSRTVFSTITPDIDRIPGAIAPFDDKAPNCRSETNPATPPGLFAARQKFPQAILPNAPPQGDKVGGRRFFSRQDAAENGQD